MTSSKLVGSSTTTSDSKAWADSLSAVDNAVDPTSLKDKEVDSLIEADALTDVERLVDSETEMDSEGWLEVFAKTTLSTSAKVSSFVSETIGASDVASSALAVVASTAPPKTVPTVIKPFKKAWPFFWFSIWSCCTLAMMVSSTCPRTTRKRPRAAVDARSQFFPDLINLKRTTRSVSRKFPFERLNCMIFPLHCSHYSLYRNTT